MNYSELTSKLPYNKTGFSMKHNITGYNGHLNDNPSFEKYQEERTHNKHKTTLDYKTGRLATKILKTQQEDVNELTKLFFSDENIERIQKQIKREIYEKTNRQFKMEMNQDESDLLIAMQHVYENEARYLPFKLVSQCKVLNKKVLEYIVPDMITQVKQAYGYIQEINRPIKPIPRSINVNSAGRKTLPSLTSSWYF